MIDAMTLQRAGERALVLAQRRGPVAAAVEGAGDAIGGPAVDNRERGDRERATRGREPRPAALDPPAQRGAAAQHGIDALDHIAPVAGADIAPLAQVGRDARIGRGVGAEDEVDQLDRGLDAGGRSHQDSGVRDQEPGVRNRPLSGS